MSALSYATFACIIAAITALPATSQETRAPDQVYRCPDGSDQVSHEALHATLWVQTSAEYRMATSQAFMLATLMAERALANPNWTASIEQERLGDYQDHDPAVILDIDETILSNDRLQGRISAECGEFSRNLWTAWVATQAATRIDGAREFVRFLRRRNVKIYYVTNRDQGDDNHTVANLRKQGFPLDEDDKNLLSRRKKDGWTSDKTNRRAYVAKTHRILLLIGDDLNDFILGARGTPEQPVKAQERRDLANRHRNYWGTKWIMLPNPIYGSWERALYDFDHALPRAEKLNRKRKNLLSFE